MENNNKSVLKHFTSSDDFFDLFIKQSLVGFFIMEVECPIVWEPNSDIKPSLDKFYYHQKVVRVNKAFLDQYGFTESEVLGMTPADFFVHNPEHGYEVCRKILMNGHVTVITDERNSRGSQIWIEGNYSVIYDKQGRIIGLFGIQADITERVNFENSLRESELQFRTLYENAAVGLYKTTPDGKIIMANPTLVKMLGYNSLDDISKMNTQTDFYFDPDYRNKTVEQMEKYGQIIGAEAKWFKKDGSIIYVRENARVIKDDTGKVLFYEGTIEDITERKLAIEALIESERKLRETNSTKDKFFSIIAHDLRSPFQGLLGIANILIDDDELTLEERLDFEKKLLEGLKIQFSLLDNLLAWSRLQRGIMEFHPAINNLAEEINEALIPLMESFERKNQSVNLEMLPDLMINYDKNMMATVLRNLLSNANKFTGNGGTVSVKMIDGLDKVIVMVADSGIGIAPEDIGKIFKVDSHFVKRGTNDEGGTGLGLSLCKEFIDKHKGEIWVETKIEAGSKFYFTLPK